MKNILYMILGLIFAAGMVGCTNDNAAVKNADNVVIREETSQEETTETASQENSGEFWENGAKHQVSFLTQLDGDETFTKGEGTVVIDKVGELNHGAVYEMSLTSNDGTIQDLKMMFRFYVTDEKIYEIQSNQEISEDNLQLIYQPEELMDKLDEDEKGEHIYIQKEGKNMVYHYFDSQVESGFYQTIVWNQNRTIAEYKTGYGAQREPMELTFLDS